jgi:hypothetical protein
VVLLSLMIKSLSCAAGALAFGASAAVAGPYANVEANAGWVGSDYSGNVTDLHLGYEHSEGPYSVYVQGGPALVSVDGMDSELEFSGKIGGSVAASDKVSVYAEIAGITGDLNNSYGGKLGAKWAF